jgi:lipoprotein-releasing system ATP-binding protein
MAPALELRHVARSYAEGAGRLDIFKNLALEVYAGEIVALVGQSGAGKSSLLHIAGLLEAPTAGDVFISGQNCTALDDTARTRIRRIGIGFVYQFHHLLPEFSALENVIMPQLIAGVTKPAAAERAKELLDRLGLADRFQHRPAESPVANSSGWPSRGPLRIALSCCWPMNPQVILIRIRLL